MHATLKYSREFLWQNVLCFIWETQQMCHCFVFSSLSVFIAGLYQGWTQLCDINSVLVSRKEILSVLSLHPHGTDKHDELLLWGHSGMSRDELFQFLNCEWVMGKMTGAELMWCLTAEDNAERKHAYCVCHCLLNHIFHKMGILG